MLDKEEDKAAFKEPTRSFYITEFNFRRAWRELASPAFNALPANVRDLYTSICVRCEGMGQSKNLNMPWPDDEDTQHTDSLQGQLEKIPSDVLAQAAQVIHNYGHWRYDGEGDKTGGHWKFANYIDQVLRVRLGARVDFPPTYGSKAIRQLRVIQGCLRVCFSTKDRWSWVEFGPATEANLAELDKMTERVINHHTRERTDQGIDDAIAKVKAAQKSFGPWDLIHAVDNFSDPKGTVDTEMKAFTIGLKQQELGSNG